jgi:hypothetical protein
MLLLLHMMLWWISMVLLWWIRLMMTLTSLSLL